MKGLLRGVDLRAPAPADAAELAALLGAEARAVAARLEALGRDPAAAALVATDAYGAVAGLVALGWACTPLEERPVARLTALVVAEGERRRGLGRLLLKGAARIARAQGCEWLEVAAGGEAALFCAATGFEAGERVWRRGLRRRGGAED